MNKLTLDEAIKRCEEAAELQEATSLIDRWGGDYEYSESVKENCRQCAADHRQLAEWLKGLKEAKSIIRVCSRVLGFLLECEIENTSTRHKVEILLKNIAEYLSGGDENDT